MQMRMLLTMADAPQKNRPKPLKFIPHLGMWAQDKEDRQTPSTSIVHNSNCTQQRLTAHFISKWIVISWPQCRPSKLKLSCPHNQCHLQHLSQLYILHIKRGCRLHRFGRTTSLWAALRGRSSVYLLKNLHNCGPVVYSLSWTIADRVKHFYKLWTVLSRPDWV